MKTLRVARVLSLAAVLVVSPARGVERPDAVESSLGVEVVPELACSLSGRSDDEDLPVLVTMDPAVASDVAAIDPLLACARDRHLHPVIRLIAPSGWQSASDPYAELGAWLEAVDRFLVGHRSASIAFELGESPEIDFEPASYAFLVEKVGTLLRSLDPDARLIVGPLGEGGEAWLARIPPARVAPYIEGIALRYSPDLRASVERMSRLYPAVAIWLHEPEGYDDTSLLTRFFEARAAGVRLVFAPEPVVVVRNLILNLPARFVVDSDPPPIAIDDDRFNAPIGCLLDPFGPEKAIVLSASSRSVRLSIGSAAVARASALDLATGRDLGPIAARPGVGEETTVMTLTGLSGPFLLRYLATGGPRGAAETVGVTAEYEMSAEEIIARMRAVEADQGRLLRHYTAKATLSYHYRAEALNEAVDSSSVNRFYWHDGVGEYQETDLFVNGARWRGQAPSLPFIQAEKVKEVPIDIRLDTSYVYRLDGRETIDGAPCYVVAFDPVSTDRSLYSGRVWVNSKSFVRRRIRLVQHGLKEPITSNADTIEYGPIRGTERVYWLPTSGYRQMVLAVLGRTLVVERSAIYEEIQVNDERFDQLREESYATGRPILREDAEGYSILVKKPDGIRTREVESLRNTAIFGGVPFTPSSSVGFPFVGLNYFDFNWRDTGTQVDLAVVGPFVDAAWTDPRLGLSRWELSFEARLIGIGERLKRITDAGREQKEDLQVLQEHAFMTLAHPLTQFSKVELQAGVSYENVDRSEHTDGALILPVNAFTGSETARWRYHRAGYLLSLWASASQRSRWDAWGFPGGATGTADEANYQRWGLEAIKSFYTGRLQKISLDLSVNAGRKLDRFSRFQIGEFGNIKIRGYNGADITFDRGISQRVSYQFTLPRGGVSLDVGAEGAVIENEQDFGIHDKGIREYVVGGGFGVTWNGPWGTLVSVRSGWSLDSSLQVNGTSASSRLVFIKTFDHWPFSRSAAEPPPPSRP